MMLTRTAYTLVAALVIVAPIASRPAIAHVKRIATLPDSLVGAWVPSADACKDADKLAVVLSANSYKTSQASCDFMEISETPGPNGPIYSVRSSCTQPGQTNSTQSNLILRPEDSNRISIGPDFETLKLHQKCVTSPPNTQ